MGFGHSKEVHHYHETIREVDSGLRQQLDECTRQLKEMEEQQKHATDPEAWEATYKAKFDSFIGKVQQLPDVPKLDDKTNVAILGDRGVGKSSTINALAGAKVAETDFVECTAEIARAYESTDSPPLVLWDVPGETDLSLYTNLSTIMQIKKMSRIVVMYIDSIKKAINLIKLVDACKVPLLIVRNKTEDMDASQTERCLRTELSVLRSQFEKPFDLMYIAAKKPSEYKGIEELRASLRA